ncbi:MAG: hypothetical protein OCU12_07000 [Methanophagales archaeon]|nr:hypothetical protein [Methanophagales archaeon]
MGAIYKVVLAQSEDLTTGAYELPLDAFIPGYEKRKKSNVRRIPGKSGGINTADKKLEPGTLDLTFQIDDDSPSALKTARQTLWVKFNDYEGQYVGVIDTRATPDTAADVYKYDDILLFAQTNVSRLHMRAQRIRVTLALNTQPYEVGGDIPEEA